MRSLVKSRNSEVAPVLLFVMVMPLMIAVALGSFAAWITHVIVCLQNEAWGFLIAGAIAFPIAIVHGVGLWLGVF